MKIAFYFNLKAPFVLKIFKFLYWLFGHLEKTDWLERPYSFENLWRHNLVNKQWNFASSWNISRELFFFKNHAQNEVGRLVLDLFLLFKKALNEVKASGLQVICFNIFWELLI